jgi:hypothetical protein
MIQASEDRAEGSFTQCFFNFESINYMVAHAAYVVTIFCVEPVIFILIQAFLLLFLDSKIYIVDGRVFKDFIGLKLCEQFRELVE